MNCKNRNGDLCNTPKAPLPKGNSPVRGNVCKADKRVAVSARKLSSVCETEGFKKESYIFDCILLSIHTLRLYLIKH